MPELVAARVRTRSNSRPRSYCVCSRGVLGNAHGAKLLGSCCFCSRVWDQGVYPDFCDTRESPLHMGGRSLGGPFCCITEVDSISTTALLLFIRIVFQCQVRRPVFLGYATSELKATSCTCERGAETRIAWQCSQPDSNNLS